MGRYTKETGGGDFQQAPAGTHLARCIRIIDIGTHHGEYQGKPTIRNQCIVQWELPSETVEIEGKPMPLIVSKFYTNSLSEKANLRKDLETWRSVPFTVQDLMGFDLMKILGKPCIVSIVHNEDGKAKVASVGPLMKGMTAPPAVNPTDAFWIDEWDQAKFETLSDGFRKLVEQSDEFKARANGAMARQPTKSTVDTLDDDIPF